LRVASANAWFRSGEASDAAALASDGFFVPGELQAASPVKTKRTVNATQALLMPHLIFEASD
jgi:hypothetical protein